MDLSFKLRKREYEDFYAYGLKAIQRIEKVVLITFYIGLFYLSLLIAPRLAQPIIADWDMLEPIAYMADKIVLFILAFTVFMIHRYIGTIRQGINIMIRKLVLKGIGFH